MQTQNLKHAVSSFSVSENHWHLFEQKLAGKLVVAAWEAVIRSAQVLLCLTYLIYQMLTSEAVKDEVWKYFLP